MVKESSSKGPLSFHFHLRFGKNLPNNDVEACHQRPIAAVNNLDLA
jgi:hypothetical protein